jgi:hypothetical protein
MAKDPKAHKRKAFTEALMTLRMIENGNNNIGHEVDEGTGIPHLQVTCFNCKTSYCLGHVKRCPNTSCRYRDHYFL